MTTFSAWYTGAICHFVYPLYPKLARHCLPAALAGSTFAVGLGCTIIDNFVHSPFFYTPSFFLYTDIMQGATLEQAAHHLQDDWALVVQSCMAVWLPLQLINFTVVPPARRVVFINAVNVVWNVVIDHLAHGKPHDSHDSIVSGAVSGKVPCGAAHESTYAGCEQEAVQPWDTDTLKALAARMQGFS